MKFGKREQIVVIGLAGVGTIALFHLMVFSPRSAKYRESFGKYVQAKADLDNTQTPQGGAKTIQDLDTLTKQLDTKYADFVTSMGLVHPPEFELPLGPEEVKVADLNPKPPDKAKPEEIKKAQKDQFPNVRGAKYLKELDLVLDQIKRLREFDARTGGKRAGQTKIYFLANEPAQGGWSLPTKLPDAARGGILDDILASVDQAVNIMRVIQNPALMDKQRVAYEAKLAELGIDNRLYRDLTPRKTTLQAIEYGGLAAKGEYVPIIHKLVHATLLEQAIMDSAKVGQPAAGAEPPKEGEKPAAPPEKVIGNKPVTRQRIYEWLEINLPFEPIKGLRDNEMYFLYAQLYHLNFLLDQMVKHQVSEIYSVWFDDISYLRNAPSPIPADPEPPAAVETQKPLRESFYVVAPPDGKPAEASYTVNPTNPGDVGYAIPIVVQFKAHNRDVWSLLYDMLRAMPMTEIDRADLRAVEGGDVVAEVRFIFVPYLFKIGGVPPPAVAKAAAPKRPTAPSAAPAPKLDGL